MIGKVALMTLLEDNCCDDKVLEETQDIENFIKSLIPTGIEFLQCRTDKYAEYCRYRDIDKAELERLTGFLSRAKFKYNFDETDGDWVFGGCETLIIDLENKTSYIH